ncbi:la protein homolog [Anopheles maculipalpis]|uniref:la protein homolog n=1 Tax=Anopheles maculipalpis TaxID=1496333 RepID=UPI00215983A6|nr:la protein homolog [Anopheles maculipalpis]
MTESEVQSATVPEEKPEENDANSSAVTANEAAIIRQLEYYFGDANLAKDKFMKEQLEKDDGWVPLDVLLTFKRLKSLSEDKKVIVDAIAKSDEGLIEISEDKEKLRRHPERPLLEMNEERRKELYARTVYVKGFAPQGGTTMHELVEFFQPYEKMVNIFMRKYLDKPTKKYLFKGSLFVTFADKEACAAFLSKGPLKYKGKELLCMMQNDYYDTKRNEHKQRAEKIEERKRKKQDANNHCATVLAAQLPTGACVFMEGFGSETTRESIKETIRKLDETLEFAYIDFHKGDKNGYVRFSKQDAGKQFLDKLTDKKLTVDEAEVTVELLVEEKETAYLTKIAEEQAKWKGNAKHKGRGNRGNNNRNHHHYAGNKRKRDRDGDGEAPVKKSAKQDSTVEKQATGSETKAAAE